MLFSSITFLTVFFPACLGVYFLVPKRARNFVLFIFSLVFYAWGEPVYVFLMLFSAAFNYACGLLIEKFRDGAAKPVLVISAIINLLILCVFKYAGFLVDSFNVATGLKIPVPDITLPIGISFYTFQTMSYTVDVYRGEVKAQKNFISFGTYVALFPQLIAGPIVRYKTIAEQIDERSCSFDLFSVGAVRFTIGLGKKVLLANALGVIWETVNKTAFAELTMLGAWVGIIAFGLQLYFDFSGYSDMAIGMGKMFGFEFDENFRYPYISKSVTDFWRRWHISLGTWFRDYVYIPLGGNRKGLAVQIRNIAVVWILTGLWHGAAWNFILWGIYYGLLLIFEKLFFLKRLNAAPAFVGHIYTLFAVILGWVLFAVEGLGNIGLYFKAMFGGAALVNGGAVYLLITSLPMLLIGAFAATPAAKTLYARVSRGRDGALSASAECLGMAAILVLCTASLISGSYNPFLYFRF